MNKRWERLIRRQQWVRRPAGRDWRDGMLIGNADLGAMASAPEHLEWVLNKIDVFDPSVEPAMLAKRLPYEELRRRIDGMKIKNSLFLAQEEDAPRSAGPQRQTVSAAILKLRFWEGIGWAAPAIPETVSRLDLFDGILHEEMCAHGFHPSVASFIPRQGSTLCLRCREADHPGRVHILELLRPADHRLEEPELRREGDLCGFVQRLPGGELHYAVVMRVIPLEPGADKIAVTAGGRSVTLTQHGDADVLISVKSSLSCDDPFAAACAELNAADPDALETEHRRRWHDYWDNACADFGKYREVQKYFTFGLYEIASTFGGAPMPGLNGLSYGPLDERNAGVGTQGYCHDQNSQIPSMAFMPLNRVDLIEGLCRTYLNVRDTLAAETKKLFGCDGIFLPLALNQLGWEAPSRSYRCTFCGSAYTGLILCWAWRYSRDRELLARSLYPLLRELVIYCAAMMKPDENGVYHFDWSVPPEIFTFTRDECATVSMLKVCLATAAEAADLLGCDRELAAHWREILAHYPPVCLTPDGAFWCGPDVPFDHYFFGGHLWYPFFPAAICEDPEAVRQTIRLVESAAVERSFADTENRWHYNHEWSAFLNTCAKLRSGDRKGGWSAMMRFLELFAKENGLFSHDPVLIGDPETSEENEKRNRRKIGAARKFCDGRPLTDDNPEVPHPLCVTSNPDAKKLAPSLPEGSSAFLFMAAETLLQSHGGILRLFPGVPENFTGSFRKFLAEGGWEVSASMRSGKVRSVTITPRETGPFTLLFPDGKRLSDEAKAGKTFRWKPAPSR